LYDRKQQDKYCKDCIHCVLLPAGRMLPSLPGCGVEREKEEEMFNKRGRSQNEVKNNRLFSAEM
jgi:hypothetical protein